MRHLLLGCVAEGDTEIKKAKTLQRPDLAPRETNNGSGKSVTRIIPYIRILGQGGSMQYYQSKRLVDCQLPRDIFKRVSSMIEGYSRMKSEIAAIRYHEIHSTPEAHKTPRSGGVSDPTANKAIRIAKWTAKLTEELDCIESAVKEVNEQYTRKIRRDDISVFDAVSAFNDYGYFCFVLYDPDKSKQPARRTWSYFKTLLAYKLAEKMNYI